MKPDPGNIPTPGVFRVQEILRVFKMGLYIGPFISKIKEVQNIVEEMVIYKRR